MADLGGPRTFRPVFVRVLSVVVWVLLLVFAVLAVLDGVRLAARALPPLVLLAALAYGLLWRPCVQVSDDAVTLVNVLRDVRVPFAVLDAVSTRFALTLEAEGRSYTAWAAPAPGRTSTMGLARREAAGVAHLGVDLEEGLRSSAAPNTDSGGAALLVQHRWQQWRWKSSDDAARSATASGTTTSAAAPRTVERTWQLPLAVLFGVSAAGTVVAVLTL
jgi:Bacterial PH domain